MRNIWSNHIMDLVIFHISYRVISGPAMGIIIAIIVGLICFQDGKEEKND